MKTLRFTASCLAICALGFGAPARAGEAHSMTGCLDHGGEKGTFVLTHVDGVSMVAIAESTAELGPHVGHKVEITGETVAGTDADAHTMKVTAMKHLAASCP